MNKEKSANASAKKESIFKDVNGTPALARSLILSHFAGVFISLIACFSLSMLMGNVAGILFLQFLVILTYGFPVYNSMWSAGNHDLNRFNFGHIERNKYRGFKLGLFGAIPSAIISVLFLLVRCGLFFDFSNFTIIYRLLSSHVWPLLNLVQLNKPNEPIVPFTWWQTALFMILPILMPIIVSGVGYLFGNHDFSPMQKLVYRHREKAALKNPNGKKGDKGSDNNQNGKNNKTEKPKSPYMH